MYDAEMTGERWTLGTSGFLLQSNKLMYDRATASLWQTFTGEPVLGRLAHSNIRLRLLPATIATWAEWRAAHPGTTVLSLNTGFRFTYEKPGDPGSQYLDYYSSPDVMFPPFIESSALLEKSEVLGVEAGKAAKAFPLAALGSERVINDRVGVLDVVIVAGEGGSSARVFESRGIRFRQSEPGYVADESGAAWLVTDGGLAWKDNPFVILPRVPAYVSFWFGWYAFRPHTEVYGESPG